VGNLLFLSGVGSREAGSGKVPGLVLDDAGNILRYDFAAECHAVFKNAQVILEDAGSSLDEVVDVTVFLTHLRDDFATCNAIHAEYLGRAMPARTTVEVSRLPTPIAVELKVVATVGG
jgi:2-aminomuconate deaminase